MEWDRRPCLSLLNLPHHHIRHPAHAENLARSHRLQQLPHHEILRRLHLRRRNPNDSLALSHAFEAAYVAQTIIRPITSALQNGFNKVAQIGNGNAGNSGDPTGWVKAMDFGRQTQQLGNLGSDGGQRLPAPKDVRGTSVMPSRAPNTTPINSATAHHGNGSGTTSTARVTRKA
jgi:hypothetical protein